MTSIEELAKTVQILHGLPCRVEYENHILIHDHDKAMQLYYIAHEATNNAIRHGKAQNIVISLTHSGNQSNLSVQDDGVGIPDGMDSAPGRGLHIMNYRASIIGASLTVRRKKEGGTIVSCTFDQDDGEST